MFRRALLLSSMAILATAVSYAPAGIANEGGSETKTLNEKVQKLQTEEQEIKALYQKIEAETKLQEVQLRQKRVEKVAQAWEEAEIAKAINQKAQWEKLEAEAKASMLESRLREIKAKTDLSLNAAYEASTLAAYKANIAENELKLARIQMEKEKLKKL